jgi:hypothetical protein
MALQAVHADVLDSFEPDHPPRVGRGSSGDARDERVPARKPLDLTAGLGGNHRVFWPLDDRRERPVDVEQHGRPLGLAAESHQPDGGAHR